MRQVSCQDAYHEIGIPPGKRQGAVNDVLGIFNLPFLGQCIRQRCRDKEAEDGNLQALSVKNDRPLPEFLAAVLHIQGQNRNLGGLNLFKGIILTLLHHHFTGADRNGVIAHFPEGIQKGLKFDFSLRAVFIGIFTSIYQDDRRPLIPNLFDLRSSPSYSPEGICSSPAGFEITRHKMAIQNGDPLPATLMLFIACCGSEAADQEKRRKNYPENTLQWIYLRKHCDPTGPKC